MDKPSVILIGFSTTGKSFHLEQIEKEFQSEFSFCDSDKFVSSGYGGHIHNVFMAMGWDLATNYIETKEKQFLETISQPSRKPQLIAAGPVLVNREGWEKYFLKRKPYVIHLEKSVESIYQGLSERRKRHKQILDIQNPNFGCWDKDVTMKIENGVYVDIPEVKSLANIRKHLADNIESYHKYRSAHFDSDKLKEDEIMKQEFVHLILEKLKGTQSR